jgi:hypothetical protein
MRPPDEQPVHIALEHSVSARLGAGVALAVLFVMAMLSPLWLGPLISQSKHSFRYTNLDLAKQEYFPVTNKAGIKPGGVIEMVVGYCNDSSQTLQLKIHREIIPADSDTRSCACFIPDTEGSRPPGCDTVTSQAHLVPTNAQPGLYYLSGTTAPTDGSVAVPWRSEVFTVVGRGDG